MAEQVRLTGDRFTEPELNDSIAFSRYTEAIDRISHQYSLWEDAQNEYRNYQEMYRTAEGLARSIGFSMPTAKSATSQDIDSLPRSNIANNYIDVASKNLVSVRDIQQEIKRNQIKTESEVKRLDLEKKEFIENYNQKIENLNYNLKRLPYPQPDEIKTVEYEIKVVERKLENNSKSSGYDDDLSGLLFVIVCIGYLFFFTSGKKIEEGAISWFFNLIASLILTIPAAAATMFVVNHAVHAYSESEKSSRLEATRLSKDELYKLRSKLSQLVNESNNYSHNIEKLNQEILECKNVLKSKVVNFDNEILILSNNILQHKNKSNEKIDNLKDELISQIIRISSYASTSKTIALELSLNEFARIHQQCKPILGLSLNYWENGLLGLSSPRMLARPWDDNEWISSYHPQLGTQIPDCISVGHYLVNRINPETNQKVNPMEVPAMIPVRAFKPENNSRLPGHIVIFSNTQTRSTAIELLESIATRLISTFPVRTLKGSFIDPIALGNTFPFKGLPKSILSGQQIFTRNQDIREELKTLVTHVEQVIQNYLGRTYETLEDYNADSQSIAEPYRYLFIADFPTAFDSNTADELKSLITNGSRAGVYSIIHVDTSKGKLRDFDYELFDQYCTVIDPTDRYHNTDRLFEVKLPNGWKRDLLLDRPPSQDLHQHIIQAIVKVEKTIKIETVAFTNFYPETLWQSSSQQELRAPIGLTGAREQIEFWLGENDEKITVSSGLLAGKPGAGKSYTLHSIILSLAMQYSPDELELYLLDYKEGVEFQIYVDPNRSETQNHSRELDETRALPHAKVISIESDREFGLSVLQAIQKEIETRGQIFKDIGVSELKDYRQKTNKQIPRVLVVIDEFQYMFQDNDTITRELNQLYEDITRRGRSFGVHLLLASQSLNINNINNRIYGFIPLRMAMQMDQTTANIVLAEGNTDAVELLDRSGRIIYNTEFGRKRQNQLGQIADVSLEARRNAMNHIHKQATETHYQRSEPIVIFQGNRPSKLTQNGQLLKLTKLDRWLPSSQLNKQIIQNQDWLAPEVPSALWIGEAMRIGHHTQAILRRRARSNMLLIGQSESNIFGMISGALLSLVHIHAPTHAEFHIIDLSQTDDDDILSTLTTTFKTAFQDLYPIKLGKRFPDPDQSIKRAEKILEELHATLQIRKQIRDADPDAMNFGPSIFFIAAIGALSRAKYLRPIAGQRNDEMSPHAKQLQELTTVGPELGIHTLLWLDNATTFKQLCANNNERTLLSQFDCRAVLKLSTEDSRFFLGEPIAQNLPSLRGYFYDASLSEGYEKFKPYAIPSSTEIHQYAQALTDRNAAQNENRPH